MLGELTYAFVIATIIILLWIFYIYFIYRWSPGRVAGLIIKKVSVLNNDLLAGGANMYQCNDVIVGDTEVSASVTLKNANSAEILQRNTVRYKINTDPCTMQTVGCISI